MDFFVPYDQLGVAQPGPWQNASPAAGLRGSILNALVFPAIQNEILNVQDAAGLTRNAGDFTQLLQALKLLIPKYAPAQIAYGSTSEGGLKLDASNNFGLDFTNLNGGVGFAASDSFAFRRASDGALLAGTIAQLISLATSGATSPNPTNTRISTNTNAGLSLGGTQTVPNGVPTVLQFGTPTVPAAVGTYANGTLTMAMAGWYNLTLSAAVNSATTHSPDSLTAAFNISVTRGGTTFGFPGQAGDAYPPSGAVNAFNAAVGLSISQQQYLQVGDKISVTVNATNFNGDATHSVSSYTNLLVSFFNP